LRGDRIEIGELAIDALHQYVTVEAEDLAQQLDAKAVHHRHHNDENGNARRDADAGEDGNHRNEGMLAARAQIAQGDHALEARKGAGLPARRGAALGWRCGRGGLGGHDLPPRRELDPLSRREGGLVGGRACKMRASLSSKQDQH